jgi:hypothetical protein
MEMNKKLGEYFLSDSRDYLNRYEVLKENSTYLGNRSKLLVDLMFAAECLLKATIFFESSLSEKETYSKIITHNLKKLYNKLSQQSKGKYDSCIKIDINKFQVTIRYQLESEIDFRNEQGILDSKYYDTIANPIWLDKIYNEIKCFSNYVEKLNPVNLIPINISEIDLKTEMNKFETLKSIRDK